MSENSIKVYEESNNHGISKYFFNLLPYKIIYFKSSLTCWTSKCKINNLLIQIDQYSFKYNKD